MMNDQTFLSIHEAAGLLRVSPWTVRGWLKSGKLPGLKAGTRVLVKKDELLRFLRPRAVVSRNVTARDQNDYRRIFGTLSRSRAASRKSVARTLPPTP